jgi:hypothetical protein
MGLSEASQRRFELSAVTISLISQYMTVDERQSFRRVEKYISETLRELEVIDFMGPRNWRNVHPNCRHTLGEAVWEKFGKFVDFIDLK